MENKIIKILKQNHLYDETRALKIRDCNKLSEFLDTYKINHTNKQKLPNNITRDENGRIILDEIPFIPSNKKVDGRHKNTWIILNNGTKLFIKNDRKHYYNECELIIMYFLKSLNINCANYDIATFKNNELLISPSFLRNGEEIIKPFEEIPKLNEGYETLKAHNSEIHFLKTCFADRIYGNIDRFPLNFGIITGGKICNRNAQDRICPLFDNFDDNSTFFREEKYGFFPYLDKNILSCNEFINYLLEYEEIMHWVNGPLRETNLYNVVQKLCKEKNIYVDDETYSKFQNFFKDSETIINEELKNKGKSLKIKLT